MFLNAKGIIEFSPDDVSKKHIEQSSWKKVAMIRTNCDLHSYYAWFLKTRFNLKLNPPLRGTHITFISDRISQSIFSEAAKVFDGKRISFSYDPANIRSNGEHWWLNISSVEAEDIRQSMGLKRTPYFGFHLTLGISNPKYLEHSKYILECCKKFNL